MRLYPLWLAGIIQEVVWLPGLIQKHHFPHSNTQAPPPKHRLKGACLIAVSNFLAAGERERVMLASITEKAVVGACLPDSNQSVLILKCKSIKEVNCGTIYPVWKKKCT
jgi:hypothetical protein